MISRMFRRNAPTTPFTPSPKKNDKSVVKVENDQEATLNVCEMVLNETVLGFLEWMEIGRISKLNKEVMELCDDTAIAHGMWMAICRGLGNDVALYVPENPSSVMLSSQTQTSSFEKFSGVVWKRFFFDSLWPARGKWGSGGGSLSSGASDFKINVCVRFRPLIKNPFDEKLGLPLHQYIRLRRQQAKDAGRASSSITVGTVPPEEFLDGIFGSLMRDPVKLPSSGIVVDRFNAEKHLRHSATDLMDGSPLEIIDLIEMPELSARLSEWRQQLQAVDNEVDRVSRSVIVQNLVDSNSGLPPEVIEALVEAERISALSKRAEAAARENTIAETVEQEGSEHVVMLPGEPAVEIDPSSASELTDELLRGEDRHATSQPVQDPLIYLNDKQKQSDFVERRKETPRVLGLQSSRVVMFLPGQGVRNFDFSRVLESEQERCYHSFARPSVVSVLNGFNSSLFCYGQTGSGKSHTIFGPPGSLEQPGVVSSSGLAVRVLDELISGAASITTNSKLPVTVAFSAQYVEIYNDVLTDLLTGDRCEVLRSDSNAVSGAVDCPMNTLEDGLLLLRAGQVRKRIAATAMNDRSSRAHSVFVIHMRQCRGDAVVTATLQLVDLAGSERLKKSKAEGSAKVEAVRINESLLVLGKVISALIESKSHIPYFESKLTTLLKNALGGASRTTAVVCCRAEDNHAFETLQALRFGERCSLVSNQRQQVKVTSAKEALASIDATLKQCTSSAAKLRERGKDHLPAFKGLEERMQQLSQRRRFIADIVREEETK